MIMIAWNEDWWKTKTCLHSSALLIVHTKWMVLFSLLMVRIWSHHSFQLSMHVLVQYAHLSKVAYTSPVYPRDPKQDWLLLHLLVMIILEESDCLDPPEQSIPLSGGPGLSRSSPQVLHTQVRALYMQGFLRGGSWQSSSFGQGTGPCVSGDLRGGSPASSATVSPASDP